MSTTTTPFIPWPAHHDRANQVLDNEGLTWGDPVTEIDDALFLAGFGDDVREALIARNLV